MIVLSRCLIFSAVILSIGLVFRFPPPNKSPSLISENLSNAVIVTTPGGNTGSGLLLSDGTSDYVLTCNHVATSESYIIVQPIKGEKGFIGQKTIFAIWVKSDNTRDLALLKLDQRMGCQKTTFRDVRSLTEQVYEIANFCPPLGVNSVLTGTIAATGRSANNAVFDQSTVFSYPGASGSAVYDYNGRCIGLVSAIITRKDESMGYTLYIPFRSIKEFLSDYPELVKE